MDRVRRMLTVSGHGTAVSRPSSSRCACSSRSSSAATAFTSRRRSRRVCGRGVDPKIRATWVAPANMHLTVRFIGEVRRRARTRDPGGAGAAARHRAVRRRTRRLRHVSAVRPAARDLDWPRAGPAARWPRCIDEFDRRLLPLGFEPEDRPFSAHLTLARIKDAPKGAGAALREALRRSRHQACVRTSPARPCSGATCRRKARGTRRSGTCPVAAASNTLRTAQPLSDRPTSDLATSRVAPPQ